MNHLADLERGCSDIFAKINKFMIDRHMPGHLWTARLELAGLLGNIDRWIVEHCDDLIGLAKARELREFFETHPAAGYTVEQCIAALKQETHKWTGGKDA